MDGVSYPLWVNVSTATAFVIVFVCLFGPMSRRGKLSVGVRFGTGFNTFSNHHY